jgi:hypothetical protein
MKSSSDYFVGFVLIFCAVITYLICQKNEASFDSFFDGGVYGKARIIGLLFWILFGHIYGAIAGVIVGFWFIFKQDKQHC